MAEDDNKLKKFIEDFKVQQVLMLGVPFGLAMGFFNQSIKAGVIGGLCFGAVMSMMIPYNEEGIGQAEGIDYIVIRYPKALIQLMLAISIPIIGFGSSSYFLVSQSFWESVILGSIIVGIGVGGLWISYAMSAHQLIGEGMILVRQNVLGRRGIGKYLYSDIERMKMSKLGALNIYFRGGKKIQFSYLQSDAFIHLPEYRGEVKNEKLMGLYQLKQELERRKLNLHNVDLAAEEKVLSSVPIFRVGVRDVLAPVFVGLVLLSWLGHKFYTNETEAREKLAGIENEQELLFNDVRQAFEFRTGDLYEQKSQEWLKACNETGDYRCRLASYLYKIGDDNKMALNLVSKSCSEEDPLSCYGVLKSYEGSEEQKARATQVLDKVCAEDYDENKVCCSCYSQLKNSD